MKQQGKSVGLVVIDGIADLVSQMLNNLRGVFCDCSER